MLFRSRNQLSPKLSNSIYQEIGLDYDEIIHAVYRNKWPNRFLASCAKLLYSHKSESEITEIIESELDRFAAVIKMYNVEKPLHIVGSIGFYFKDSLRTSLIKYDLELGIIIKSPGESLINFHFENG